MQYLRGWRALRQDPEWVKKIGIASVMLLLGIIVPIVGPILVQLVFMGWMSLMLRRAVSGQDSPLPRLDFDFDYLKKLVEHGFKAWLAAMVWRMPAVAFAMASFCCMYVGMFGLMFGVAGGAAAGGEAGGAIGTILSMLAMCLFFVVYFGGMIVLQMPVHMAVIRAEITDDMNKAMRFKEVVASTKLVFKELLIGQFVMGFLTFAIVLTGELMLCVGLFPAAVIAGILMTYWHAELYKAYLEKGGEPLPVGPLTVDPEPAPYPSGGPQGW